MPGRWTLTATGSPLCRTARWTWPIEAAANDSWLNDRKTVSGLGAELLADDLADFVVRERRDLVEELEQLVAVGRRQQVEAEGQHLAQLDPGATEALEGEAHPDRAGCADRQPGRWRAGAMKKRKKTERTCQTRRGCLNSVLMWRRPDQRRRAAARSGAGIRALPGAHSRSWSPQDPSSSMETRRRRVGREVSSSHSRPARTSSANVRRDHRYMSATAPSAASWPSRPRRMPAPHAVREHRLAFIEGVRQAALTEAPGVGLAFLGGRAVQPRLAALPLAARPTHRSRPASARASVASSVTASPDASTLDSVMSTTPWIATDVPTASFGTTSVRLRAAVTAMRCTVARVRPRTA